MEKSTVPVRTAEAVRRVLATNDKGVKFQVHTPPTSSQTPHAAVRVDDRRRIEVEFLRQ